MFILIIAVGAFTIGGGVIATTNFIAEKAPQSF